MADMTWYSKARADAVFATKEELAAHSGGGAAPDLSAYAKRDEMQAADAALGARIDGVSTTSATKSELSAYLTSESAGRTYATKTELAQAQLGGGQAPDLSGFATKTELGEYLKTADAANVYATKTELEKVKNQQGGSPAPVPAGAPLASLPLRPGQPVPTVGFFGDSWSTEAMMGPGFNLPAAASRLLGCIPMVSAVDGSGFAHSSSGQDAFEVDARVNSVCGAAPNLIVTVGSLNSDKVVENGNVDGSNITQAVKTFVEKVRAKLPQVPIVIVGPEPSSVARLISRPSHVNVKAAKAGVEAAGGAANGVVFVDWLGVADKQAVVWSEGRACAEGDVVVYGGVAYRVSRAWTPASGETPLTPGAPTVQVSDVLSGTGHEGAKKGDGTRDTLLMSDETHPTKIGSVAFGAALAKHVGDAVASLESWIKTQGPVVPSAPPAPPTPPSPPPAGLPIMAWLQAGWGVADRVAYSKEEVDSIIALKPDRIALPLRRTDDTIGESGDAGVAIPAKYTGSDGVERNFSDGSIAGIAGRGVKVASMLESLDAMEAAGITPMPNPRDGLEDYSAQWTTNSSERIIGKIAGRAGKSYEFVTGRAENALRDKLVKATPGLTFVSDNTDGPADWQVTDVKNCSVGVLGATAGAPGWGAAKTTFPGGVWALVSNKDEQSAARSLAEAAGVTILGWAVGSEAAFNAIKA